MSRAGVQREHAERTWATPSRGIEGIYNQHGYSDEKAEALRRLAALIDGIVRPHDNVLPLKRRGKRL